MCSSQSTANAGQSGTFWDYVYANSGSATPSGSVAIYDDGNFLTTANLVSTGYGYSYVTWTTSSLGVGNHTVKMTYNPSGAFQGSIASLAESINSVTTSTSSDSHS